MSYDSYTQYGDMYLANNKRRSVDQLPGGVYELRYNSDTDQIFFKQMEINHDDIIELPSKEYKLITNQLETFMRPETKEVFNQYGFIYKRSVLMHGLPGTGKTILVDRISNYVLDKGGIVLFNPKPSLLSKAYDALNATQPEVPVVVIFEELDQLVRDYEDDLLHVLDGEVQRSNVIYLATTNYIDKVPARIMRPGRFSTIVEIKFPKANVRKAYLKIKLGVKKGPELDEWVKKTEGLSIDEVKETVLAVKCLNDNLDGVITRIKETKELTKNDTTHDDYYMDYNDRMSSSEFRKLMRGK